jgi:hypothetical protein
MIAKIVQSRGFKGVINYVLDKDKAQLIMAEGVRLKNKESVINSFIVQSKMNPISKPVAHISLDFSVQDKDRLTNSVMLKIATEYMKAMGYNNTQFIIARHNDTDHPHIHLVINRIDNDSKRISDKNEKLRSTKVCMELTKKYGLYIAKGKENVKEHRLKEPDKTKYEIYHSLQSVVARSTDWAELIRELKKANISTQFKYKGGTSEVQGVKVAKNGYEFSGSKIDRQFSFSKIDYLLNHNARTQGFQIKQEHANTQNHSSVLETATSIASGLFNISTVESDRDHEEAEFQKQHSLKKKQKRRGMRM